MVQNNFKFMFHFKIADYTWRPKCSILNNTIDAGTLWDLKSKD